VNGFKRLRAFFIKWVEQYLFFPTPFQRLISLAFLPLTVIYCVITAYGRVSKRAIDFEIPVISIGNIIVGGTGKTPVIIALAKQKNNVAIILRGYGRDSKGLLVVSKDGKILQDTKSSGDEAILLARSLPNATVIVSENRIEAILKAKELACEVIYLDDGYRHHGIKKFDILLRPKDEPTNVLCLPSGGYRDTKMMYSFADMVLREAEAFKRIVTFKKDGQVIKELPSSAVLLTAISKANRLFEYLPKEIKSEIYQDHYDFTNEDIQEFNKKYENPPIVTTAKDLVKLEKFNLKDIYLMDLEVQIDQEVYKKIDQFIDNYFIN